MVNNLISLALAAAVSFAPLGQVQAAQNESATSVNSAKSELMALLSNVENLSAAFTQNIIDIDGETLQQGHGVFTLAKPNLLNWQTNEPDESTIIADGENIWLFDPFIEQVTIYPLAQSIANTPILLLTNNDESLWQQYQIEKVQDNYFNVVSISEEAQVKQLQLSFTNQTLNAFTIVDATGQQSQFALTQVKTNQPIAKTLFTFAVPEGVLVDDQR